MQILSPPRIAIDAMGGDDGLATMLAGVALAQTRGLNCRYLLVGQAAKIEAGLAAYPELRPVVDVHDHAARQCRQIRRHIFRRG